MITTNLHPPMGMDVFSRINSIAFSSMHRSSLKAESQTDSSLFSFSCRSDLSVLLPLGLKGPVYDISFRLI